MLAGFILLVLMIGGTLWFVEAEQQNRDATRHAVDINTRLYRVLSLLQDAETGQRGYLLTGQDDYLAPYAHATTALDHEFEELVAAVDGDPTIAPDLTTLHSLASDKLAELDTTIARRRAGDLPGAMAIVRDGSGKAIMDKVRATIGHMIDTGTGFVVSHRAAAVRSGKWLEVSVAAAGMVLVALGTLTLWFAARQMLRVVASRDAIRLANDRLVQEVMQRERIEEQLRQSQKMEAMGQLTGGLAHDLNNMLGIIIGSLNLIARRHARGSTELGRFIEAAMEGAQRAATLTYRLLAFSRQQPLSPEPIDVNKFVSGISDLLRRTLGETVRIETVLAGGLWRTHADAGQLENTVINLALNARDAMPDGGRLTIETANCHLDEAYAASHAEVQAGQYVMLAVTDTGTGMPTDIIAKAFEPFFTTKGVGKGTGLGLSQVYGFVKQSAGHIKIYSEVGQGTTVKLYLPRFFGANEMTEAQNAGARTLPAGDAREIILVVEDEERFRQLTVESLRELGYTVLHADGANAALRILDSRPDITLLFTDIVMPEVNGRRLADEAQRRKPELRVLYTTGYTRNAIVHNGVLDAGVQLISKPFTLEQLAMKVREVLEPSWAGRPAERPDS